MSASVSDAVASLVQASLERKAFHSGSRGFHCQGQVTADGHVYQVSAQSVLVGSRKDPLMQVRATAEQAKAALVELITAGMPAKDFSTGKTGYFTSGTLRPGGEQHQAQAQAVLVGG
jgi:hypothetical protein